MDKMRSEWQSWLKTMASENDAERPSMQQLGANLSQMAPYLDHTLKWYRKDCGGTMIHGDFKTANIFFLDSPPPREDTSPTSSGSVAVCDFQWFGPGLGVQDVMYLIWTSVDPDVVRQHEQKLLSGYHSALVAALELEGKLTYAGNLSASMLQEQYEVCTLLPHLFPAPYNR